MPVHLAFRLLSTEEPSLISLVITDLTEQKRHEKIVASEAFSSSILDQAADAVVVCDESGRIIRTNRAAQRLCGTNPLFEPFDAAFPLQLPIEPSVVDAASDHSAEQFALFPLAATARVVSGVEAALPSPGGLPRELLINVGPLLDRDGKPLGCIITMTDISEQVGRGDVSASCRDRRFFQQRHHQQDA